MAWRLGLGVGGSGGEGVDVGPSRRHRRGVGRAAVSVGRGRGLRGLVGGRLLHGLRHSHWLTVGVAWILTAHSYTLRTFMKQKVKTDMTASVKKANQTRQEVKM